ncbi:TadE/TadG family type IV pilus assembly protein [Paenarthrobacter ureafaciens]|uniref:TadE/TadG family type IV pilus assembly protein n=1 Tax=Paenarthrobacter ureafaciens TaxID=37931 RepID=UPI002263BE2C|nr:TadE family protein [Paenarthrobacter ureafaciens]MCX8453266.1 pilus assembly protein [Paenarthrobacter ureafaciens]MCY0972847.1 pilus assembly protein [Paenarthrobacter ureafaciens]
MSRRKCKADREHGAVAVEFALVAPILLLIVVAVVEFAFYFNLQISVTQAAREAARTMAITDNSGKAQAAAVAGAPSISLAPGNVSLSGACAPGATVTATVTFSSPSLTGLFAQTLNVTGEGAMRCGG